jgi:hypothetical protein
MYTERLLNVYRMPTERLPDVYTARPLKVHQMYTKCTPNVHRMSAERMLERVWDCPTCAPRVQYTFGVRYRFSVRPARTLHITVYTVRRIHGYYHIHTYGTCIRCVHTARMRHTPYAPPYNTTMHTIHTARTRQSHTTRSVRDTDPTPLPQRCQSH